MTWTAAPLSMIGADTSSMRIGLASTGVADTMTIAENSDPMVFIVWPASAAPCGSRLPPAGSRAASIFAQRADVRPRRS